ncbi:MAG: IS110 family transposase [Bacillota bacterium]
MEYTTFVGLDVHKDTIAVAVAKEGREAAESLGTIINSAEAIAKLVRKLGPAKNLYFCYEAGPCGYGIYRQLTAMGATCMVVAPSLIPRKPGERVKTDRRDAKKLAQLLRSGELTSVWVPDGKQEALRDLVRAREDAREDIIRKRNQIIKFLLRLEKRPPNGVKNWTIKYRQWLGNLSFNQIAQGIVLKEYIHALEEAEAREKRIEKEIAEQVNDSEHAPVIAAFQVLRGVGLITAVTVVAEAGDLSRFDSPKQLMSYVGLTPSESSSGGSRYQGRITKSGNSHIRRVIVESAWHYRRPPSIGPGLRKRQEGQSEEVKAISWKAQHRLNLKFRRLTGRGKLRQTATVAVARELLGFMWAIAQEIRHQNNLQEIF